MSETGRIPPELSSFVGRAAELAAIGAALAPGRVLTLVGPGGCGKTRLAMRIAHGYDAVWCGLEQESDPGVVANRVADAAGVLLPAGTDPPTALADGLHNRTLLVVLDNCEHLLAAAAEVVGAVLARCPAVTVLATSRTPLGLGHERVWPVPPLALGEALELFHDRAGVADSASARRVCDRLDRLPLALELAAGWAGTLSPAQIADSLRDPYALLDGGSNLVPFRQQSLEASMRWSHDLLDDRERELFRRLSVFEPGFDAEAVTGLVAPDNPLPALRGLIDKSLIVADTSGPVARYRMLGVVREYAAARLAESGETTALRSRHLAEYLRYAEALNPLLDTDKDSWRAAIGAAYPNLRAALDWGLHSESKDDVERAGRLAGGIAWLWHLEPRGAEGLRLLRLALDRAGAGPTALRARLLTMLALVSDTSLPGAAGYETAYQGAALATETGDHATARLAASLTAVGRLATSVDDAHREAIAARDAARAAGDEYVADASAVFAGLIQLLRDDYRTGIDLIEPCVDGLVRRGDRGVASSALSWLALAKLRTGDLDSAAGLAERAVTVAEPLRDFHRTGSARGVLAEVRCLQGRPGEAAAVLEPMARLVAGAEEPPYIDGWERIHALLALAAGDPQSAVEWCRRERAGLPDTRITLAVALRRSGDTDQATVVLDELAASPTTAAMPRIRAAILEQRARLAPDSDSALDLHHEALRLRAAHDLTLDCVETLESLASLAIRRDAIEQAGILIGAARRAREEAGAAPGDLDVPDREAIERGRSLDLTEAIAYATRSRGPRRRPDTGWASLTPTERSVAGLAAQGLSNPEIAERLFVSRGTVKTHLQHVYAKLQIANRTELARLVSQHPS